MEKLKNFEDVFSYVNERYVFNKEHYPVMANLTEEQQKIFALKHGLIHLVKSFTHSDYMTVYLKESIYKLSFLAFRNSELGLAKINFKAALLKTIINIVSIAATVGFTVEETTDLIKPTDEEMRNIIPASYFSDVSLIPCFNKSVEFFIEKLAAILEKADHTGIVNTLELTTLTANMYRIMRYWFDAPWVPNFLAQIPSVMKSK